MVEHPFNFQGIANQPAKRERMTVSYHQQLLQLCVLRLGLLQDGDLKVCGLPKREKISVGSAGVVLVACEYVSAPQLHLGQRTDGIADNDAAVI
jgi:hypothetical protein